MHLQHPLLSVSCEEHVVQKMMWLLLFHDSGFQIALSHVGGPVDDC